MISQHPYQFIVFVILCLNNIHGWRLMHHGRIVGGNLGSPILDKEHIHVPEEWFDQLLDHFNPIDTLTWKQRFYTLEKYFKKDGPVFLMIGGEGAISDKWMAEGQWIEYAKVHNALCFQLEHRYYGKSHPTSDLSTENLVYLSSEQALADLAYFITGMQKIYNLLEHTKWIVFGGSYPGSLAAWARAKYPHLVHAAVSSSAPLLAKVDFKEYYEVVEASLATSSAECVKAIKDGTKQIGILLRHMIGMKDLDIKFRLCDLIEDVVNSPIDVSNFYKSLAGNFAGVVQYNRDNRKGKDLDSNITIDVLCGIMIDDKIGAPVTRLAEVNSVLLDASKQKCLDYRYRNMINSMKNTSWLSDVAEGGRQWTYQTCTEFGFYQTSNQDEENHIFGENFPVEFFVNQCTDIFGANFSMQYLQNMVDRTNTIYGALDISSSRTVFVHGSIDPWHALGITKSRTKQNPAIYIDGAAHCANMYPASDADTAQLRDARVKVGELLTMWIQEV